jgi:hypothetical protein
MSRASSIVRLCLSGAGVLLFFAGLIVQRQIGTPLAGTGIFLIVGSFLWRAAAVMQALRRKRRALEPEHTGSLPSPRNH